MTSEERIEEIKISLSLAWHEFQTGPIDRVPPKAFEHLYEAVEQLVKELGQTNEATRRAANVASCLANGIQPD